MRDCVLKLRVAYRVLPLLLLLHGCEETPEYHRFEGATMGTYFRITALCPEADSVSLEEQLERELVRVNAQMSTYQPDSELMRFNNHPPGEWVRASPELVEVVAAAAEISSWSSGAFDVTISELVDLWGFGPGGRISSRPSEQAIAEARTRIGFKRLEIDVSAQAIRRRSTFAVDLSAIAKGYAVDRLSQLLEAQGCDNYLVDIGGEVRGVGLSPSGRLWRIGVEVPDPDSLGGVQKVLELDAMAVATSGDYRNFLDLEGERYSHTLDPRSGYPVAHALASVTVLHPSAMWADGYATALNVLGPEMGFELAEVSELAAFFLIRRPNGYEERYTAAMLRYLDQTPESSR